MGEDNGEHSPLCCFGHFGNGARSGARSGSLAAHTESTLRSDVLPAFCKPTMVTSISVALHKCQST